MSLIPESHLGIWLDMPVKFLENTPEKRLRNASNEALWITAANDNELLWGNTTMLSHLCFKDGAHGGYLTVEITDTRLEDAATLASGSVQRSHSIAHRLGKQFRVKKLANWFWPADNKKNLKQPRRLH